MIEIAIGSRRLVNCFMCLIVLFRQRYINKTIQNKYFNDFFLYIFIYTL